MAIRNLICLLMLCAWSLLGKAQVESHHAADSTTYALYQSGNWQKLADTGKTLLNQGVEFPYLRLRLAYALFMLQDYSGAIGQYNNILESDSYNPTARYYLYLCHKYLNHDLYAAYQTAYVDSNTLKRSALAVNSIGAESSYKIAQHHNRGNAFYSRAGLSLIAGQQLQIDQSVAYFKQYIYDPQDRQRIGDPYTQSEYFIKLNYAPGKSFSVLGSYHYMNTNSRSTNYNSHIVLFGINYAGGYLDLQADAAFGHVIEDQIAQYNAALTWYPYGNLNLYTISRLSYHHEDNASGPLLSQAVGFKAVKNLWLETSGTFGNLDDYIDTDGLYVYNAFDNTKLKLGETVYLQITAHALLQFNYTYEKKLEVLQAVHYNQHSITAGLLWKF